MADEESVDFKCVLDVELPGPPKGLDVGCENKKQIQDSFQVSGLCNWIDRGVIP